MTPAALALIETEPSATELPSPLIPYVETNPVSVILNEDLRARFFAEIEKEIAAFEPDTSSKKGRDAIKSFAFKYTRTKTAIDNAGKALNEEAKKQIAAIDAIRKEARETLDRLHDVARQPLDEWEKEEAERKEKLAAGMALLKRCLTILPGTSSADIAERIEQVKGLPDGPQFEEAKAEAIETLGIARARLVQEEADRAELARLRAAEAERQRIEAERQAAEQRAQEEAERNAREEKLAQERIEAAARRAAGEAAAAEKAKADAEIARLAAEKRKLEEAETKRLAEAARKAEEEERRQQNKRHRAKIMRQAKEALMAHAGLDEVGAGMVLAAIIEGKVPSVTLNF
jgi:hypothetical protein